jgi:hypothetical protein
MATAIGTLVFLPVGPKVHAPHLADTVESFLYFAAPSSVLVLADDTHSELGDDHLLSLSVQAAGFGIEEAGGPQGLIGYRLDRLPADYATLVASSFAIVHSVRRHGDDNETRVRAELRQRTRAGGVSA